MLAFIFIPMFQNTPEVYTPTDISTDIDIDTDIDTDIDSDEGNVKIEEAKPEINDAPFIAGEAGFATNDPIVRMIEINQCLSYGFDTETGEFYVMDNFVSGKETVIFIALNDPPDPMHEITLTIERDNTPVCVMSEYDFIDDTTLLFHPKDMAEIDYWQQGDYTFTFNMNSITAFRTTHFHKSAQLRILAVPLIANYDGRIVSCSGEWKNSAQMLIETYPIAAADIEYIFGEEIDVSGSEYDLVQNYYDSWNKVGDILLALQDPENEYTLILGFMPEPIFYGNGGRTSGLSYGPASIIGENQPEMLAAVIHEIAHGYMVGDEYPNGFFNLRVNIPPYGLTGRDIITRVDVEATNENVISGEDYGIKGLSSIIYPEQRAYSVTRGILGAVTSFMGSARDDLDPYTKWISSEIWNHLFDIFTN